MEGFKFLTKQQISKLPKTSSVYTFKNKKEILSRRLQHPEWPFPQLILTDGGKGQLNAALDVLNQHKSAKSALINVLALAKKENKLFIGGQKNPIRLNSFPNSLKFAILQLRDEAHRFAKKYHHKLREVALRESF